MSSHDEKLLDDIGWRLLEELQDLPEERELDRALPLLDEVQVRRRDPELLRDVRLTQLPVQAELPDALTHQCVVH